MINMINMSKPMTKDALVSTSHVIGIHDDVLCGCDSVRVRVTDCE